MSEHFRCLPYSATMSRSSCGKRYREASCGARPGIIRPVATSCATCSVGKAAGREATAWPDGRALELVQLRSKGAPEAMPVAKRVQPRVPAAEREVVRRTKPSKMVRGPNGERRTVAEWAGLLGVSPKVIHSRLSQGWDEARAVSAPHRARRVA